MAEVGQRLGTGVHRLSGLRIRRRRSVGTGGSLLVNCCFREKLAPDLWQVVPPEPELQPEKPSIQSLSLRQLGKGSLFPATSSETDSLSHVQIRERLQTPQATLYQAARLQPLLQDMTPCTRGAVSIPLSSQQQIRALCTAVFILAEQGSKRPGGGHRPRLLKPYHDPSTATRHYSWRGDRGPGDAPLHRSRTAYYDILQVTPGATQTQIKAAYYKQSFMYHPDKNQGNEEASQRFIEISEAYNVLGNVSLRRKYDRGFLNHSDIQSAGRPSPKGSPPKQQQQQQQTDRARRFSQAGGKPMFDFDAFYQAHYGEQLQRERYLRARKEHMLQQQREKLSKEAWVKLMNMTVMMLLATAGLIVMNLK